MTDLYTKGPWHAPGIGEICDQSGRVIGIMIDCNPVEEALRPDPALEEGDANTRRIVACVNKFGGMSTAEIEELPADVPTLLARLSERSLQCDQLLAALTSARRELQACQAVIHLAGGFDPAYVTGAKAALAQADAAIAAVKGGAPC